MIEAHGTIAPSRNGDDGDVAEGAPAVYVRATTKCALETFRVRTERGPQFLDITDKVRDILKRSGIQTGFAIVFSRHTTAAIRINEAEPQLLCDIEGMLERIAPKSSYYRHNDLTVRTVNLTEEEDANGHAHCRHFLMGSSEAVPVVAGELFLGRWQRVFLVELDQAREREVVVQMVGLWNS